MSKSSDASGVLTALSVRNPDHHHHQLPFLHLEAFHGPYVEKTISLKVTSVVENDGKFDAVILVEPFGDLVHTFMMTTEGFETGFELRGIDEDGETTYSEGMTSEVQYTLSHAAGWKQYSGKQMVPLMLRETVDFRNCYIPLFACFGQKHELLVKGFRTAQEARVTEVQADYVFLDSDARGYLATEATSLAMITANYVTTKVVATFDRDRNFHLVVDQPEIRNLSRVMGLMISTNYACGFGQAAFDYVRLRVAGHEHCQWTTADDSSSWTKVGLSPSNCILMPFSRSLWSAPDQAASIAFSRMDKIELDFHASDCLEFEDRVLEISLTALAYKTRGLGDSKMSNDRRFSLGKTTKPTAVLYDV